MNHLYRVRTNQNGYQVSGYFTDYDEALRYQATLPNADEIELVENVMVKGSYHNDTWNDISYIEFGDF